MERPVLRNTTWNWLPTFLEVAESGSVAQASRQLGLTPPAVSRTIRLLEEHLGEPLFTRGGRRLVLNQAGQRLRESVRGAVSHVDRALGEMRAEAQLVPLRVVCEELLSEALVLPALLELGREQPALCPEHMVASPEDAARWVSRGQLDVAFYLDRGDVREVGLEVTRLGEAPTRVYCGRGHPLFQRREVEPAEVLRHAFAVPERGDGGGPLDGWPANLRRQVRLRLRDGRAAVHAALSGQLLAALPDVLAAPHVRSGQLAPVPFPPLGEQGLRMARRAGEEAPPNVRALGDAVRARWRAPRDETRPAAVEPPRATPGRGEAERAVSP